MLRRRVHVGADARHPHVDGSRSTQLDLMWIPVEKYVAPQRAPLRRAAGLNKARNRGQARRSAGQDLAPQRYDIPPPPLTPDDQRHPSRDPRYRVGSNRASLPLTRVAEGHGRAFPALLARDRSRRPIRVGQARLIAAHGNSSAGARQVSRRRLEADIVELEHPDRHSARLRAGREPEADPSTYYLGDPAAAAAAAAERVSRRREVKSEELRVRAEG